MVIVWHSTIFILELDNDLGSIEVPTYKEPQAQNEWKRVVSRKQDNCLYCLRLTHLRFAELGVGAGQIESATMNTSDVSTAVPGVAGQSLLIVDDEPVIRMIARTCLASAGFEISEAADEASAFEAIQKSTAPFDLILLDLTLGETRGADLIPRFRSQTPTTRILVISGLGAEDVEGIDADGFLGKPFTKKTLLQAVSQALKKK